MHVYLNASGAITPQNTFNEDFFSSPLRNEKTLILKCIEPEYKTLINPVQLRRMSRILKMGLSSSKICINKANVTPNSIIIGTGLGCTADLEKFLYAVQTENEQSLSPIPFVNSSHNIVGGQIALTNKINDYNITYCHHSLSFESTLFDAFMLLEEEPQQNVLVGAIDEITEKTFSIFKNINLWRAEPTENLALLEKNKIGTIAGEGSIFFMLSTQKTENTLVELLGTKTFIGECSASYIFDEMETFLKFKGYTINDIDTFVFGKNGDINFDWIYDDLEKKIPNTSNILYFKHLCGEYSTASAFAVWLSAEILKLKEIPQNIFSQKNITKECKNILIYNQRENKEHSFILLKKA